ncbi:hypothetical protein SAZ10_28660 [Mesorhizobium sp. BAC0120]|uniref:hypothetical protein n=1 Tax=Mesorhizobium sp. BAC0120 TaxID=3090670 RepID=UPI00298D3505|nr:hypothetical protein [Mesorhizobium sp. BAC0120]MDW6025743.1 hypothetical protein [Mesorhizobium sp. BAC0120]
MNIRNRRLAKPICLLLAGALLAATAPVLPRGWEAASLAAGPRDASAVASYRLDRLAPDDYRAAVEKALAGNDADLADSLRALASQRSVTLPAALTDKVDAAVAAERARMPGEAWEGFLHGKAESEPALAGALAADLTGFGDMRDLYNEAGKYMAGDAIDTTTVALAAVGLTLTAATVISLGATVPEKAGVSAVKIVSRMGRLSRPLRREVAALAGDAVDAGALRSLGRSVGAFDLAAIRTAARRILRPAPAAKLRQLGTDVATLGQNAGYRGTLEVLAKAEDATAVSRMARLSRTFGRATRGVLFMLGDASLTLAGLALAVFSWTTGAIFWIFAAVVIGVRVSVWGLRLGFRTLWWVLRKARAVARISDVPVPA